MFSEIFGLPAHPLLVHAAVVFVPLLALVAAGYAVLPRFRNRLDWAAALLAVVAPVSAYLAKESGEWLEEALAERNYPAEIMRQVAEHKEYGDAAFWWALGLALATGVLLVLTRRPAPRWVQPVLAGVVVVLGVINMVYIVLTGDSGAQAVWNGVL